MREQFCGRAWQVAGSSPRLHRPSDERQNWLDWQVAPVNPPHVTDAPASTLGKQLERGTVPAGQTNIPPMHTRPRRELPVQPGTQSAGGCGAHPVLPVVVPLLPVVAVVAPVVAVVAPVVAVVAPVVAVVAPVLPVVIPLFPALAEPPDPDELPEVGAPVV